MNKPYEIIWMNEKNCGARDFCMAANLEEAIEITINSFQADDTYAYIECEDNAFETATVWRDGSYVID